MFNKEYRYIVFKNTDLLKYLNSEKRQQLESIAREVGSARADDGKISLECVVVESDWPIYNQTWKLVEDYAMSMTADTMEDILNLPIDTGYAGDDDTTNIRSYLKKLLERLWSEGESFSGKRPFGNSGWEYDLYVPLVKAGIVEGEMDEDNLYLNDITNEGKKRADRIIFDLIDYIFDIKDEKTKSDSKEYKDS